MLQALRCKPRTHCKSAHLHSSCCKGPGPRQCTSFKKFNQVYTYTGVYTYIYIYVVINIYIYILIHIIYEYVTFRTKKASNDSLHMCPKLTSTVFPMEGEISEHFMWQVHNQKLTWRTGWTNIQLFRSKIRVTPCHCVWRQRRTGWTGWTNPEIDAGHVHLPGKPAMQYAARVVCPGLKAMQCTATD